MTVYLVPVGRGRFEAYSETHDDHIERTRPGDGTIRHWLHKARKRWNEHVERAQQGSPQGRFARWRDAAICRLSESIAEQRTLWALANELHVTLRFPSTLDADLARTTLMAVLADARRHHLRWLGIDLILLIVSSVLALVPGPNVIAYYLAFRVIGHVLSWVGARRGTERITWTFEPDGELAELGSLADVPREARASRVDAIAERLKLPRLSAFFDRVAIRSS
jgi:hypothetical protein